MKPLDAGIASRRMQSDEQIGVLAVRPSHQLGEMAKAGQLQSSYARCSCYDSAIVRFMPTLVFVRHGITDWNVDGRFQGQLDIPLNAAGRRQADAVRAHLESIALDHVY